MTPAATFETLASGSTEQLTGTIGFMLAELCRVTPGCSGLAQEYEAKLEGKTREQIVQVSREYATKWLSKSLKVQEGAR